MSVQPDSGQSQTYFAQLVALIGLSATQLVRSPSSSRRAEAARRLARQALLLIVIVGAAIVVLMVVVDAREISSMPPRGTAGLWPVRIFTDFGKAALVLWALAVLMFAVAIISPRLRGSQRSQLLRFGTHLEFLFFAVLVPVLAGEVIKWIGRDYDEGLVLDGDGQCARFAQESRRELTDEQRCIDGITICRRDRQSQQPHRQRANRRDRSAVCPVGVVDRDQERRLERGALEQLLQVAQQPEALLGLRMKR